MQSLIDHVGVYIPDDVDEDVREVLKRGLDGHCMACNGELGSNVVAVVKQEGVIALYCGGACLTDHQIVGYLEEQHDDVVEAIKFRGGAGDQPEE
jgi:hypothetical protein